MPTKKNLRKNNLSHWLTKLISKNHLNGKLLFPTETLFRIGSDHALIRDSRLAQIAKILISCRAECIFQNFNAPFYNAPIVNAGPLVKRRDSCTRKRNFDFKSLHLSCKQAHVTPF